MNNLRDEPDSGCCLHHWALRGSLGQGPRALEDPGARWESLCCGEAAGCYARRLAEVGQRGKEPEGQRMTKGITEASVTGVAEMSPKLHPVNRKIFQGQERYLVRIERCWVLAPYRRGD